MAITVTSSADVEIKVKQVTSGQTITHTFVDAQNNSTSETF